MALYHSSKTKRIALATFFGVIVYVSKIILPTPIDKMFLVVQALLLALSSLILGRMGATYTATVEGLLTSIWRVGFFPYTIIFSVAYGLIIDGSFYITNVRMLDGSVKPGRLVASLSMSTATIGFVSMYVTVLLGLMPWVPILYLVIIILGIVNGSVAGYLTLVIWRKYPSHIRG